MPERVKLPKLISLKGVTGTKTPTTLAMLLAPKEKAPKAPIIINPKRT